MAKYRQVHCSFWDDPEVEGWTTEEKLFFLYLITNPHSMQCGISTITKKRMSSESGISLRGIDTLLVRFQKLGKIKYNDQTSELALRGWRKYNPDTSPTVKSCIDKELLNVKDRVLIEYLYSTDKVPLQREEEEEREREENNKEKEKNNIAASPENLLLAEFLFSEMLKNDSKRKEPNFEKWANDFRLLREQDNRDDEKEIRAMIILSQTDKFWKTVVLSANKFRQHYPKFLLIKQNGKVGATTAEQHENGW